MPSNNTLEYSVMFYGLDLILCINVKTSGAQYSTESVFICKWFLSKTKLDPKSTIKIFNIFVFYLSNFIQILSGLRSAWTIFLILSAFKAYAT